MTGWPIVGLRDLLKLDLNRVPVDPSGTYPMVGVYSFGRGLFRREAIQNGATSYREFYRLKADHVVMSQLFGWEGALALSSNEFEGCFVSPQFPTFLCDESRLDRCFLGWLMARRAFWDDLGTRATGMGDRRRTLSPESLFACKIPLPSLPEQRRIVARIEELAAKINEACGLRESTSKQAEALVRSKLEEVFRGLSKQVGLKILGDVCHSITDGDHNTPQFCDEGIRFIFVGNVSSARLHFENTKRVESDYFNHLAPQRVPERGDILYSAVGATLGIPAIVETDEPFCFQRHVAILKLDRQRVDSKFVWYMLRSRTVFSKAWSSTTGSAQPTIPLRAIRELPIPVPSLSVQRQLVGELDALQEHVDALTGLQANAAAELQALLPSTLDKVLKGEL